MTKEEYEEMRNTIDSVGKYFNSIEELTEVRDIVEEVDASNSMTILESPVKLDISNQGMCSVANEDCRLFRVRNLEESSKGIRRDRKREG